MNTPEEHKNSNAASDSEAAFEHTKLNTFESIKKFFTELFDIHSDTDREATIEAIKKDISFKGHTAWILIFSIFVASIGLNVSSAAVVIGAMLISPLMGPIVGIGLAVAINDVDTMKRSLINLGVMVVLSVLTACLYFWISPLTEETPELLARTYPTILDVLVAIFGGLGLIVAKTKSGTIASVIFGVAIATALMPPLCTVGYGLAIGNFQYAGGAMYLFSINAVFIALATFIVAKILRFPMVKYANSQRRRFIARIASLVAIVVMVPSVWLFINLLDEQIFDTRTKEFVKDVLNYDGAEIVKFTQDYETKSIDVYLIGRPVPQPQIDEWVAELKSTEKLEDCNLRVYQGTDQSGELAEKISGDLKTDILSELYVNNEQRIRDKNERIDFLEEEITKLKVKDQGIPFEDVSAELRASYEGIKRLGYSNQITTNFEQTDTILVFHIDWDKTISSKKRKDYNKRIASFLKLRLKIDTLRVREERK